MILNFVLFVSFVVNTLFALHLLHNTSMAGAESATGFNSVQ